MNGVLILVLLLALAACPLAAAERPNVVLIFVDDLGFGDLGSYGSLSIQTPNIDRLATEGVRLTQFYSSSPVCSSSRAALLTGRYAPRTGVPRVLHPDSATGLRPNEKTIASVLKARGYKTLCVGKWHLGHLPQFLPTSHGFDSYFGMPYSNDMPPAPLMRDSEIIESPAVQATLTRRYTEEAVRFIAESDGVPFFLYLPHTFPHLPLAVSERFRGRSRAGLYGDTVEEVDWSVGEVLSALKDNGVDRNTLVIFTSDNGPAYEGSAGAFRGRKGVTWEGGVRVPFLARFPSRIPSGEVLDGMATTLDMLPTIARIAGASLPEARLDGVDIWPLLSGETAAIDRDIFLYFDDIHLQAARMEYWKMHVTRYNCLWTSCRGGRMNLPLPAPELYDLRLDPSESYDVASLHPEIVREMWRRIDKEMATMPEEVQANHEKTMAIPPKRSPAGSVTFNP